MAEKQEAAGKTEEEFQKELQKQKRGPKVLLVMIFSVLIILAVIIIVARYYVNKSPQYETYFYNGFSFTKIGPLWYTSLQTGGNLYNVPLHFGPRDLQQISMHGTGGLEFLNATEVYITFDPTAENMSYTALAAAEISQSLVKYFGRTPIAACLSKEDKACIDRPIINCTNTEKPVIFLDATGDPKVIVSRNCIIIRGSGENLVKAADRFLLGYYGIMQ